MCRKSIDVIDDYLEEMWEEQNFLQRNNPVGLPGDATRGYSEFQNYVAINVCSLRLRAGMPNGLLIIGSFHGL